MDKGSDLRSDLHFVEFRLYEDDGIALTLLEKSETLQPLLLSSRGKLRDIFGVLSDGTQVYVGHINLL